MLERVQKVARGCDINLPEVRHGPLLKAQLQRRRHQLLKGRALSGTNRRPPPDADRREVEEMGFDDGLLL